MAITIYAGWCEPAEGETPENWYLEEVKIFKPATVEARQTPGEYPIATQTNYTFQEHDTPTNLMDLFNRLQNTTAPHDRLLFFSSNSSASILPFILKLISTYDEDFGHFQLVNEKNGAKICFDGRYKNIETVDISRDRMLGHICLAGSLKYSYEGSILDLISSSEKIEASLLEAGTHTFYNYPENMLFTPAYQKTELGTGLPKNWWYSAMTGEWMGGVNEDVRNLSSTFQWRQFITGESYIENPPKLKLVSSEAFVEIGAPITKVAERYVYDSSFVTEVATPTGTSIKTNSLRYYSLGTEIKGLFQQEPSSVEEFVYLENGYISRRREGNYIYYRLGYGEKFIEWRMLEYDFINYKYELYLITNEKFAKLDAFKWAGEVPEEYIPGDFGTSPFLLYRYCGSIAPSYAKVNFFDYDQYQNAIWPLTATNVATGDGTVSGYQELLVVTGASNATKETWTSLLGAFKPTTPNFGEGSIGGGFSKPGGGSGSFDDSSDKISGSLPSSYGVPSLMQAFVIDSNSLTALGKYLNGGIVGTTEKEKTEVKSSIYALKYTRLPFVLTESNPVNITPGGEKITNFEGKPCSSFFVSHKIGSFTFNEYFGNFLDYQNTKIEIYLPYVGVTELPASIVMGKKIEVTLKYDLFSGSCVYVINVVGDGLNSEIFSAVGVFAEDIVLSSTEYTKGVIAMQGITGIGKVVAGGITKNPYLASSGVASLADAAKTAIFTPETVSFSGNMGSFAGLLGVNKIFIIITRPKWSMPENYGHQYGFPSNITSKLGDLSGFTKIADCHLENVGNLTQNELDELYSILKEGVIL